MKKIYLLTIALAIFSFVSMAQDIVVNGGYETWTETDVPDNWTTESGITLTQETSVFHGGSSAVNVMVTTGSQGDTDFRQTVNVEMGKTYDISVWVYHTDTLAAARLYVGTYLSYSEENTTGSWQEMTYQYTATENTTLEIGLRFYDQDGFVDQSVLYVDDFMMVENVTAPVIENIMQNPTEPTTADAVSVSADVTDNGTLVSVTLTWTNDGGTTNNDISMTAAGNTYTTDTPIPAQASGTTVSYFVTAIDNDTEQTASADYGYYIGDFCNGDFEAWTAGAPDCWNAETGTVMTEETGTVHGGSSAMHVDVTTASQGDTDFRQVFNAEAGQTYDVSVWVYQLDTLSEARLYFGSYQDYSDKLLTNQWQEVTYQFTASASEAIEVGLRFYDQSGFVDHSYMIIDDFTIETSTGINRVNKEAVSIFPNPVRNVLTVEANHLSSIEIMDINAKTVKTIANAKPSQTIDVSGLQQGIYFVKTKSQSGVKVSKLIKL